MKNKKISLHGPYIHARDLLNLRYLKLM